MPLAVAMAARLDGGEAQPLPKTATVARGLIGRHSIGRGQTAPTGYLNASEQPWDARPGEGLAIGLNS
jgi:hypothetical protein